MANRVISVLVIIAAGVLAYLCATQAGFLPIDDVGMTEFISRESFTLKSLLLGGASTYYRPLVVISYLANFSLFGLDPVAFHAVNIAIHIVNSLLVYRLALALLDGQPQREWGALVAGLFFLLNPLNSEAVIWVSARPDLMCTFFFILAMVLFVERREQVSAGTLACFAAACLASLASKESSIALLGIVPPFVLLGGGRGRRDHLLFSAAVLATAAVYALLRAGTALRLDPGVSSVVAGVAGGGAPQLQKGAAVAAPKLQEYPSLLDAVGAYGFYLKKLLLPFPLNFTIVGYDLAAGLASFLLGGVAVWYLWRRHEKARLPLLIVLAGIVPPLLAYLGRIPWTPFGERYLYLPMVGFSLLVALVATGPGRVPRWVWLGGVLLLAVPTISRGALWCDKTAFWEDCLRKSPGFAKSHSSLGAIALDEQRYDDAERHIRKAQALGFNEPVVWQNLARIYSARKDYLGYEEAMAQAAARSPHPTPLYQELAGTLMWTRVGDDPSRYAKAVRYHLLALSRDPSYLEAYYNVGKLYYSQGDLVQAQRYLRLYTESVKEGFFRPFALRMLGKIADGKARSLGDLEAMRPAPAGMRQ